MRFAVAASLGVACVVFCSSALAQPFGRPERDPDEPVVKFSQEDKFRQLDELLPTPNVYRTASGAPGHMYWQQEADFVIEATLDDKKQRLTGTETVTYHNHSPDTLRYLWLQMDRNRFTPDSDQQLTTTAPDLDRVPFTSVERWLELAEFDGGFHVSRVVDRKGEPLEYTVVKTMMRIDLPEALQSGDSFTFTIDWDFNINDSAILNSRTAAEFFEEDGNWIYEMAHWFPRMAAYTDYAGWQHKQFLGNGEFTLEFGDYDVKLTVPEDHVVSATGVLQNAEDVLTTEQRERLKDAATADAPVFIVTPEEAKANEEDSAAGTKTWHFKAEDVRDFAFASSRKFIWDAMGHDMNGHHVMAMSFYPKEGEPLWSKYSTHSIIHTLNVYSRYTFRYPYPVAQSVNGSVGGMEYPMICFNGPRPEEDGTYSARTKYGLISVIIHEVGHNYFPMIVNSDERQWTWMDEGLNTFCQFLAEQEWEDDYPSRRGEPQNIVGFMTDADQRPIMTNSESLLQFGSNAYAKPATALNILRETILGRELFDFAFREYSQRWMFKRPEPADFFRTMEDASGVDLDWFWRGWFYSTDHVDISIDRVSLHRIDTKDPVVEKKRQKRERDEEPVTKSQERNEDLPKRVEEYPDLLDFYNKFDELDVTPKDRRNFERYLEGLEDDQADFLKLDMNFYIVEFSNIGGLVMPVLLEIHYDDGTVEEKRMPAEIWRRDAENTSTMIVTEKTIESLALDPHLETADADLRNNFFPRKILESRFELFEREDRGNPMQEANEEVERAKKEAEEKKGEEGGDEAPARGRRSRGG
jgi:hypothetical protein